jgi:hypothetical protein
VRKTLFTGADHGPKQPLIENSAQQRSEVRIEDQPSFQAWVARSRLSHQPELDVVSGSRELSSGAHSGAA